MSDPDAMPDPIDKAYVEAEAVLSDEAARAARRERVLAAVATQGAPEAVAPARRAPLWRRGGWLVAACVTGLALFIASQVYQPPQLPGKPTAALRSPPVATRPAVPAPPPSTLTQAPPPPVALKAAPPQREPVRVASPAPPIGAPERGAPDNAAAAGRLLPPSAAPPVAQPEGPEPLPPLPPPPPPPPAAQAMAPSRSAALANTEREASDNTAELVVTGEKRQAHIERVPVAVSAFTSSARDQADPGFRLRAAAAAGRTAEVQDLLRQGAPVDAPDVAGNTALMQSIQSDHPAAAAALRRHGASLDHRNQAGESARDMAKARNDAKLDQALGLSP